MTPRRPAGPRAPPRAQDEGLEPGAVRAQAGGGWQGSTRASEVHPPVEGGTRCPLLRASAAAEGVRPAGCSEGGAPGDHVLLETQRPRCFRGNQEMSKPDRSFFLSSRETSLLHISLCRFQASGGSGFLLLGNDFHDRVSPHPSSRTDTVERTFLVIRRLRVYALDPVPRSSSKAPSSQDAVR